MPLRYPGGKQRFLAQITRMLPPSATIKGRFIEPFVGGGAVFFARDYRNALLSDINIELIDLYRGIRYAPRQVWHEFRRLPASKAGYYRVRGQDTGELSLVSRAARTLFLNRTCFKGMWRHNAAGQFNVGYGGQSRRWVICEEDLVAVASRLRAATLCSADFEDVIDDAGRRDFLFLDPPYKPGKKEMHKEHYVHSQFTYADHVRLAAALDRASRRGTKWVLTTSAHIDIRALFKKHVIFPLRNGAGTLPGIRGKRSGELLIAN